jgi:hypothetical protein
MDHVRPDDKTATLGLDQRYQPLHIKQITLESGDPAMQSMWRPDADELAALNAGGVVVLNVLGRGHPPVHLTAWSAGGAKLPETDAQT